MVIVPQLGEPAPDFSLAGTEGTFSLADQRGRRVVLLFYPADNSPVCTRQFCSYRDHSSEIETLDAVLVGISAQDVDSHQGFAARHGLNVPLLADEGGRVAKLYGVWRPVVGTKRATFVVDEQGIVRHREIHALGLQYEDVDDLRTALSF